MLFVHDYEGLDFLMVSLRITMAAFQVHSFRPYYQCMSPHTLGYNFGN